ncbi:SRPBCC family protein [Massilia sp. BJB1822]|uniref:SRPBCC family protein n=1 Tax=Massilia sp. BJB1822 TaxID=2744470 RepID=UPI001593B659|nr:SRPBCC family protein [Massilia sp. BJB1822]NVE01776.1 SRPBCC family protein [Massilia sp. BJB1822]
MTTGVANTVIRQSIPVSPQGLWGALVDLQRMAKTVPDVRHIAVAPGADASRRLVDWTVWLKGFELQWQEAQVLDARAMRLEFHQSQGMFAHYQGSWQVREQGQGSELEIRIEFDSGLPHLSQYVNPVLAEAFEGLARELAAACGKPGIAG